MTVLQLQGFEEFVPSLSITSTGIFSGNIVVLKLSAIDVDAALIGTDYRRDSKRATQWSDDPLAHPMLIFFGRQSSVYVSSSSNSHMGEGLNYNEVVFMLPFVNATQSASTGPRAHAPILYLDDDLAIFGGRAIGMNKIKGAFSFQNDQHEVKNTTGESICILKNTFATSYRPWDSTIRGLKKLQDLVAHPHVGRPINADLSVFPFPLKPFLQFNFEFDWGNAKYRTPTTDLTFNNLLSFSPLPSSIRVDGLDNTKIYGVIELEASWKIPLPGLTF
jgi:hypothetical protein